MALDKLVDSTQLDADLTSVANAIRTKGGTSAQLAFPNGFISAIQNLGGDGLTNEVKQALLQIGQKVAYIDTEGQQYYNDLMAALYPVDSISAVFTQGSAVIYTTDSLDALKQYLVVTANYSDGSSETVTDYTLSGTLTAGTSTITVSYNGKTATFSVTVTAQYDLYDYIYNSDPYDSSPSKSWDECVETDITVTPSFVTLNAEFEAVNSNDLSASEALMGAGYNFSNVNTSFIWYARANKGGFSAYYLGVAKQLSSAPRDTRCVCKYVFVDGGQSYLQYNGTNVNVATVNKSSLSNNTNPLVLAGGYQTDGSRKYGLRGGTKSKLGYIKFINPTDNSLVYHFVPAHDVKNDKWGFYEDVNDVFYPSNGTGFRCANWL